MSIAKQPLTNLTFHLKVKICIKDSQCRNFTDNILKEFILTTEIQCKESYISNLIYTNSGCKKGSTMERVLMGIQVDGAGGNASQDDVKPEVPNFSYNAQTHMKKHNSVKNNSQPSIDLDSLTSDTSFSASQFADVSSDVDKKECYNMHNKAQLSKVGECDVGSNLKGTTCLEMLLTSLPNVMKIVSTCNDIEKGEHSSIVNVMTVAKIPSCLHMIPKISAKCVIKLIKPQVNLLRMS